jgi:hypothetical protein
LLENLAREWQVSGLKSIDQGIALGIRGLDSRRELEFYSKALYLVV